uniref:Uncharacterized protein n=1 Tax=Candidatus Methanogaster sp. ANME-2c ERB4 TaxID=2759911 RepID=A0A7G9YHX8_9EURY|nr:hypothetical protein PGBELJNO_00010 [Methanosarcinales archaeon ANME-2c ERB4]
MAAVATVFETFTYQVSKISGCFTVDGAPLDQRTGGIRINDLYTWNPIKDAFEYSGSSYVLDQIMEERGWTNNQLRDAL